MRIFIVFLATMLLTGCEDIYGNHYDGYQALLISFNHFDGYQALIIFLICFAYIEIRDILKDIRNEIIACRHVLYDIQSNTTNPIEDSLKDWGYKRENQKNK